MKRFVVLVVCAFALASCGNSGEDAAGTTSSSPAISTTTTTNGVGSTTSSVVASSTTVLPARDRCGVSQLQVFEVGSDPGAGQRYITFAFKNIGKVKCSLHGYPGVAAYVGARPVVTKSNRLSNSQPLQTVSLLPQQEAYFDIHYTAVPSNQEQCENADTLQVTPPDETTQLIIPVPLDTLCPSSGLDVSPLSSRSRPSR